jgi:hypothetical protein
MEFRVLAAVRGDETGRPSPKWVADAAGKSREERIKETFLFLDEVEVLWAISQVRPFVSHVS